MVVDVTGDVIKVCGEDSMAEFLTDTMRDPTYDDPDEPRISSYDGRGRGYYCRNNDHCQCGCTCMRQCRGDNF